MMSRKSNISRTSPTSPEKDSLQIIHSIIKDTTTLIKGRVTWYYYPNIAKVPYFISKKKREGFQFNDKQTYSVFSFFLGFFPFF